MKRIAAGLAMMACLTGAASERRAEDLAWLAGTWAQEGKDGSWTEERWAPPRGGTMLGTTLSGRGDKASFFEFMRIAPDADGRLAFFGSPGGKPTVAFRLAAAGERWATFENPAHDFPTRIAYRRSGRILTATVSGPGGAKAQSWTYRRR